MALVQQFFDMFISVLQQTLSATPLVLLIGALFVIMVVVNVFCYMLWGRY